MQKRITVRALAKMTHQGTLAPLAKIIMRPRQSVIDPQDHARRERAGDMHRPLLEPRAILRLVAVVPAAASLAKRIARAVHRLARRPRHPGETALLEPDSELLATLRVPAEPRDRQRIEHLIGENHPVELC